MDIFRIVCLGIVQGILLLGSSMAEDDFVPDFATPVKFDFAQWCKVGDRTFILNKTTLAEVIHANGSGVFRDNRRDAAAGEFFVDYTGNGCLIRFSSNAEMSGDDHELEGVEMRPLTAGEKVAGLPSLRLPITFQFGSLGMSFTDLVAALGQTVQTPGIARYEYIGKKSIKNTSGNALDYDVLATLRVKIVAGKVATIDVGHVTSY